MLVLVTQPAINAAIGLTLNLGRKRDPLVAGSEVIYSRYDIWTYIAIALAAFFAWQFFDKRRASIIAKYEGIQIGKGVRGALGVIVLFSIFLNFYLYSVSNWAPVFSLGALLTLGGVVIRRIASNGTKGRN